MTVFHNASVVSHVDHAIRGGLEAEALLDTIHRGFAHPDAVYDSTMRCWADHGAQGLTAFARTLQKRLEREVS